MKMTHGNKTSAAFWAGLALAFAIAFGMFFPTQKAEAADTVTDVPAVEQEVAAPTPWYKKPLGWKESYDDWRNEDDIAARELAQLQAAYDAAVGKQKFHDAAIDDLKKQADSNVAYLESIIAQQNLEAEALRLHNESLDRSIRDFQDKDNSLMYVEGCWVPLESGQTAIE